MEHCLTYRLATRAEGPSGPSSMGDNIMTPQEIIKECYECEQCDLLENHIIRCRSLERAKGKGGFSEAEKSLLNGMTRNKRL